MPGEASRSLSLQSSLFAEKIIRDNNLKPGSSTIDAGDDAFFPDGGTDLDGNPRRQGSHVDVGAYESLPAGFTIADARSALLFLSGLAPSVEADLTRLDIVKDDSSAGVLNIRDAARLARKTAGLETNL